MALELKIDLSEIQAFADKFPGLNNVIISEQRAAVYKSLAVLEQAITVRTPVNAGTLRNAWSSQVTGSPARLLGETFNPLIYAWPVEAGRKAGSMPPSESESLLLWVTRKFGVTGNAAKGLAYVIARKIKEKGTKGKFMLRDGWNEAQPLIIRIHDDILPKIIAELL